MKCTSTLSEDQRRRKSERRKQRYQENKEKENAANKARHFMRSYGITVEQRDEMIAAQGGKCAVCSTDEPGGRYDQWFVDHCHSSGNVRGILCHNCNLMLGYARDNPKTLSKAIEYLRAHNG